MTEKNGKVKHYKPIPKVRHFKPEGKVKVNGSMTLKELIHTLPVQPKVLSKRARRMAKKGFRKCKQVPNGYELLYRMNSVIDSTPLPTEKLKLEWMYLDSRAIEMFRKKYDNLTAQQRSKLIDSLHKED